MEILNYRSNTDLFEKMTSEGFTKEVYMNYVYYSFAIGVDNINREQFNLKLASEIKL